MTEKPIHLDDLAQEFAQHRPHLYAYAFSLCQDHHLAEDTLQDIWLALTKAVESGVHIQQQLAWCRGVARHLMQKHWRENAKQPQAMDHEMLDLLEKTFDEAPLDNDAKAREQALKMCLENLAPHSKNLLELKYSQHFSFAQMSKQLQKTENSLMMAVSRLRKQLGQCIESRLKGGLL
jgi:RNA polymerase sigma-70 factor, ECF subfamily